MAINMVNKNQSEERKKKMETKENEKKMTTCTDSSRGLNDVDDYDKNQIDDHRFVNVHYYYCIFTVSGLKIECLID